MSLAIVRRLLDEAPQSPLRKSYINTLYCGCILSQVGKKITAKYCGNRWCLVCNSIRMARLINGYAAVLEELPDKHLVTLTVPNVQDKDLSRMIDLMLSRVRHISDALRKRRTPLIGLRKLEVTHNYARIDYHPHLHFLVSGEARAKDLVAMWLDHFPEARDLAQDISPWDGRSPLEMFKYFAKLIGKPGKNQPARIYPGRVLDTIFCAMKGHRVFQPMGIKMDVQEELPDDLEAEVYEDLQDDQERLWKWHECDWVDEETGELLTGYVPSPALRELLGLHSGSP